jgi:hypothetical protein
VAIASLETIIIFRPWDQVSELQAYEHLLFEQISQADLQRLYALYADWQQRLEDSPEAVALCDALDTFIEANLEAGPTPEVEQAYLGLVQLIKATSARPQG